MKVGDRVVCVFSGWNNTNRVMLFVCPARGDVLKISQIRMHGHQALYSFEGYPPQNFYAAKHFRPLVRDLFHQLKLETTQIPAVS